jgi:hypothetical protein
MDPNAAWQTITDRSNDLDDRADAAAGLMSWLDHGGFVPDGAADAAQAWNVAALVVAEAWRAR